jgi:serine phosphatase RsbU (regulator of sigma subunit)
MHFGSEHELVAAETRSRAVLHTVPEPSTELPSEGAIDLRTLIGHRETVRASDNVESVFDTFRRTNVEFLAIIDGDRLLEMCSRHAIDSLLGGRYGFSLWARRPIAEHVAADETRIAVTTPITDVLQKVFARNPESIYDDVLLVDEDGRLLGLISTETLFKVQNALLRANISQLERKEREIRDKNEQIESDLQMAMELQQAMMPKTGPHSLSTPGGNLSEARFDHRYVAASLVGGDFFHIVRLSDSVASVFICDVMGHGVRSALITAMLRALIESCGADAADPSLLMTHLNSEFTKILRQTGTVLFATAFYCVLDSNKGELRYARAGHPYPFHVQRRAGVVSPLKCIRGAAGPALGLLDSAGYGNSRVPLEPGDWVLLFTDGIEEAANNAGVEFGVPGLTGVLQANLGRPAGEVLDQLLAEVTRFADGAPFVDDVCLVAAELPAQTPPGS